MLLLCIDPAIHACNLIQWWLPVGALPVVDILSVPHTAHQWHTTACVLCLLAVPILSHCVRHCLLLVTIRMRPLQKGSTNLDHTEQHCHWSRHRSQVFTFLETLTSLFFWVLPLLIFLAGHLLFLCPLLLVCTLAHTVPVILHYLTEKKSSAHLCGDRPNATRLLHACLVYINCVVLLRQPGTQLFELVASSFSIAFANGFHVCLSRVASYLTSLMHFTFTSPQCWPLTVTSNL